MSLILHRADRADALAQGLAEVLSTPLDDPFARELVVVAAPGVERWLAQTLSHRLGTTDGRGGSLDGDDGRQSGICAGVDFVRPHHLLTEVSGRDPEDPWSSGRLTWPVLDVISEAIDEPWLAVVARHLGRGMSAAQEDLRRSRRYTTAHRTAGLLHSYAVQRPWMVQAWRDGDDTDGLGGSLPTACRWQVEVFRRVSQRLQGHPAPDQRLAIAADAWRRGEDVAEVPGRLSLFGHTRLPRAEVELLAALGAHREVHLWLPHPSRSRWERRISGDGATGPGRPRDRAAQASADGIGAEETPGNRFLASCARDADELQRSIESVAPDAVVEHLVSPERPDTLLGWLQRDLADDADTLPTSPAERDLREGDGSVQIHACHGAARQVDVLRETIVGLLQDDPTLEPRDVIVMCPDIETFAPYIDAAFGLDDVASAEHPGHGLRVRLADRSAVSINPVADTVRRVVAVAAGGRATATDVRDLLSLDPVRRRFALSDDDLEQVDTWVHDTAIRWGLAASTRERWGLSGLGVNTWNAGLDRVSLGAAVDPQTDADDIDASRDSPRSVRPGSVRPEGDPFGAEHGGGVLPLDDFSSTQLPLIGSLSEALARLGRVLERARGEQPLRSWCDLLEYVLDALTAASPREAWQSEQVRRIIADLRVDQDTGDLTVNEIGAVLDERFAPRPTRSNFRTGSLTVCTMVPMRSVPHRVVCLLGLDADTFPRTSTPLGDDVLAATPLIGERDAVAEDRQLFCDAVMSASQTLVITYTGASEHTGRRLPPATPVGELLDQLQRTVPGVDVASQVTVSHPLQSFDERSFRPGALVPGRSFSFDGAGFAGAEALRTGSGPTSSVSAASSVSTALLDGPLPPWSRDVVTLDELRAFVSHPVRAFVQGRLDVRVAFEQDPPRDDIPLTVDALEQWQVAERLLAAVLDGADGFTAERDERLRGALPPGALADQVLARVRDRVRPLALLAQPLQQDHAHTVDVDVTCPDGRRIVGTVAGVRPEHAAVASTSKLVGRRLSVPWLDALALAASGPDAARPFHLVGRVLDERGWARPGRLTLRAPTHHDALRHLTDLLDLWEHGMREPLALPPKTSQTYADLLRRRSERAAAYRAAHEWEGTRDIPGERDDAYHRLAFGADTSLDMLLERDLARHAERWWNPLLDHLERTGS